MSTTKVFVYKGVIGIDSTPTDEGMVAPYGGGNLGVVMHAEKVLISKEALELLSKIRAGRDAIGDVDAFMADQPIFSWFGGHKRILEPSKAVAARGYKPSLLKTYEGEIEIPADFKEFVDDMLFQEALSYNKHLKKDTLK